MLTPWIAVVLAAVAGLGLGLVTPALLRGLPEPSPEPGGDPSANAADRVRSDRTGDGRSADDHDADKIPYASLATQEFALVVGVLATVSVAMTAMALPIAVQPTWLVLGTLGLLLAAIDARTTWLPLPLTRLAWLAMAGAEAVGGLLGGWLLALRGVGGFLVAGAVFGAAWLLTRGGFGFGDVRYAPLVGAATASTSWTMLAGALLLGSLVGAVVALVRLGAGRRGSFAYAPSILAGGYLAVALNWLTR